MLGWQEKIDAAVTNITGDLKLLKTWSAADPPFSTPDGAGVIQKLVHHTIQELCGQTATLDPTKYKNIQTTADAIKKGVTAVLQAVRSKDKTQFDSVLVDLIHQLRDMKTLLQNLSAQPAAPAPAPVVETPKIPITSASPAAIRNDIKTALCDIQEQHQGGNFEKCQELSTHLCVLVSSFLKLANPTPEQRQTLTTQLKGIKELCGQPSAGPLMELLKGVNTELRAVEKTIEKPKSALTSSDTPRPKPGANRGNKKQSELAQMPLHVQKLKTYCVPGDPADHYIIESKLGEGASGTVWRVQAKEDQTYHAMKKVPIKPETIEGIVKEVAFMSTVKHVNALAFSGCYLTQREVCIVMELCDAGSVLDILVSTGRGLPKESYIMAILGQTLCGLAYLHAQHKIHRDIKAGNLLLTSKGEVKIADFGTSAEGLDRTTVIGSVFWMAPETLDSRGHGPKADIWSLGITLIEMAQKDPPNWEQRNLPPMKIHQTILHGTVPGLSDPSPWSSDFVGIINSCLKKDPQQRPSAEQLLRHPSVISTQPASNEALLPLVRDTITRKSVVRKPTVKIQQPASADGAPKPPNAKPPGRTLKLIRQKTGKEGGPEEG